MAFPWIALAMGATTLIDAMLSNKSYPPELEALLKTLNQKGVDLANSEGLSSEEVSALFGKNYENVRGQGKNIAEATTATLAPMGMSKTGTAVKAAQQGAWANEQLVTNAIRDTMIAKKQMKQQDISLAAQIAGGGVGAEVNRIDKGPDFTSIMGLMGLMGVGTGQGGVGAEALSSTNVVNPLADSLNILGGRSSMKELIPQFIDPWPTILDKNNALSGISSMFSGKPW